MSNPNSMRGASHEVNTMREDRQVSVTKIVITGGPCAGKTTAMSRIHDIFTQKGYSVIFVPETATELITGGVAPWTLETNVDFQICQVKLQLEKEEIFDRAAHLMRGADKVLIVCDRGVMDNKAYMNDEEFAHVLDALGLDAVKLRDSYDAVFHLVTVAKGHEEFYTLDNNTARTETVEEAVAMDDKLLNSWVGHPHFRVVDNSTSFDQKMDRLIAEISSFLGEAAPYEIERKFLIEYPNINALEAEPSCRKVEIIQTYLRSSDEREVRVRQRGENGNYVYFKTVKKPVSPTTRIEVESRLSRDEYIELLEEADPDRRPIQKTRYCLMYKGQYFEIDIYPFWNDRAIVERELVSEDDRVQMPPCLKVIREVTDDPAYKNSELAKARGI